MKILLLIVPLVLCSNIHVPHNGGMIPHPAEKRGNVDYPYNSNEVGDFGPNSPATPVYGQMFTPGGSTITSFSLYVCQGSGNDDVNFQGFLAEWDSTIHGPKAPFIFTSATRTLSGSISSSHQVTFSFAPITLDVTKTYYAALSGYGLPQNNNPSYFFFCDGTASGSNYFEFWNYGNSNDPTDGAYTDVQDLGTNQPQYYYLQFDATFGNTATGGDDPVFLGFNDVLFSFPGRVGEVFNIFNDEHINLNSLFGDSGAKGTIMVGFGIQLGGHSISFGIEDFGDKATLNIDGHSIQVGESSQLSGCVDLVYNSKRHKLHISSPTHSFTFEAKHATRHIKSKYFDLNVEKPDQGEDLSKIGGVLGDTANIHFKRTDLTKTDDFVEESLFSTKASDFFKGTKFVCNN